MNINTVLVGMFTLIIGLVIGYNFEVLKDSETRAVYKSCLAQIDDFTRIRDAFVAKQRN